MNIEKITQGKNLTDTERTVLEYILDHLDTVQTEGVRGVARANYTSTSTIMRLARKMNYSGFVDMCYKLRSFTETPHQTMQEEEDFLNGFSTQSLLNYNTYTQLKVCAEKLLEQRDKMTFVYGTGFSGTVATYLTQKLVNMGILCFRKYPGPDGDVFLHLQIRRDRDGARQDQDRAGKRRVHCGHYRRAGEQRGPVR